MPPDEKPFEVVCVRSGVRLTVPPERSIASVAEECGIEVIAWCETEVLAGRPDHRDSLLTEDERAASRTMLICVSRCQRGPLVLRL